jgi:hypothetical protein
MYDESTEEPGTPINAAKVNIVTEEYSRSHNDCEIGVRVYELKAQKQEVS